MRLEYQDKIPEKQIFSSPSASMIQGEFSHSDKMLIHGENLDVMKFLLNNGYAGKIDLVYIDPPFATNNIFTMGENRVSTISNRKKDQTAYADVLTGEKFIEFIRERILLLRELLSEHGSIYLHIDYKIGHYVKVIMDEIFGFNNFRNDITRVKCNPKNFSRQAYGNVKDLILFYSKGPNPIWNDPRNPFEAEDIENRFNKIDSQGRRYTTVPLHAPGETKNGPTGASWKGMLPPPGRHWRSDPAELDKLDKAGLIEWSKNGNPRKIIFADEKSAKGGKLQDIWNFKDTPYPSYPTEKNLEMLKTIVNASSNPESIVLDSFCGSGTTLVAAEKMHRKWIGIDQSEAAISVCEKRLNEIMDLFSTGYDRLHFLAKKNS